MKNINPLGWKELYQHEKQMTGVHKKIMKAITDKNEQVHYLKERLNIFVEVLDAIDPEQTELEDVDRLLQMIEDIEEKYKQFQKR
ncbi:hypothetical protein QY97_03052 [Bacillus thermotolerans]|uniref:Uncharacterized protein n=2 Tax=Bacillus thermotolerans TaxID=1221996 RepID=A0A0F5HKA2_BACTR|nr:hypothetical protein QY97_03052 [Bacillus thermotolerans]KKB40359.1 hypothetical protein QY95_01742 [Bacillus thermotolerans]KKB44205.1 hypothetical protein QY96_03531 [Bacillus thermotolerans]